MCKEWQESFPQFLADMGPMPLTCNGLVQIDKKIDFNKFNCEWKFTPKGRKQIPKEMSNFKRQVSKIKNPKSICLVIEKEHYNFIKDQAMKISLKKGEYVQPNQLIREALKKAFPAPQLFDMFGTKI